MSDAIVEWYRATKKMIKQVTDDCKGDVEPIQHMINDWNESLETMEAACPGIREQYERRQAIEQSFTSEQIDHICYMIGEWYIEWKDKMWVDGKPNQHCLGIAKEKLKTMICGD